MGVKKLSQQPLNSTVKDDDSIIGVFDNKLGRIDVQTWLSKLNRGFDVSVVSDTESEYVLSITIGNKTVTTPNLKSVSIVGAKIELGNLYFDMSDGTTIDVGEIDNYINSIDIIKTIDMREYTSRKYLALSIVDESGDWVPNTEVFPEHGIYKLINAKGKALYGGISGGRYHNSARMGLLCDTVYINYQSNTVDIYDDQHYTVYHTFDNRNYNESWYDYFHITNQEIDEKIAGAIPFVNKPDNSNQVNVTDNDFDSGAINRIVFPCTLCNYANKPLIQLKVNDLVFVSYDNNDVGIVQVITKEGTYVFEMCAGINEETGDYIFDDTLTSSDCILPTKREVEQLIQDLIKADLGKEKWTLLIDDTLAENMAANNKYKWNKDINDNSYSVKEIFADIVFPNALTDKIAFQLDGNSPYAIMWGWLPVGTKKVRIRSKILDNGYIETEYIYYLSSENEIMSQNTLKNINGEMQLNSFTQFGIKSRGVAGTSALPAGTTVKIWSIN